MRETSPVFFVWQPSPAQLGNGAIPCRFRAKHCITLERRTRRLLAKRCRDWPCDFCSILSPVIIGQMPFSSHMCFFCNMVRILKRVEGRVTFCSVKCIPTGEGFYTKERACIFHGTVKRRNVKRRLIV